MGLYQFDNYILYIIEVKSDFRLMKVEDISEENLEDVFKICSGNRAFAPRDDPILGKGIAIKKWLLLDMLDRHGPCAKIMYMDGKPVAQILFIPEETIPYILDPR